MLRVLAVVISLAVGAALGLAATYASLRAGPPFGAVQSAAWTAWPDSGTAGADPYVRASFAWDGRVPLAAAAGLRFFAQTDDAGRPLDGRCTYELGGATALSQFWTLTLLDPDGRERPSPDPRQGFTSSELIRNADGGFTITLARRARPGNWLPTRSDGPFLLMLSFYETPLATTLLVGGPAPVLPMIQRKDCP